MIFIRNAFTYHKNEIADDLKKNPLYSTHYSEAVITKEIQWLNVTSKE